MSMASSSRTVSAGVAALFFAMCGSAQADLVDRGSGLIYDTDLNVTWAANANINGAMDWNTASTWAAGLVYGGISGWRLPTADPSCGLAYNCTGSEMGHLFYSELGGVAGINIATTHNANYSLFSNVVFNDYWLGTEYAPNTELGWDFNTSVGRQDANYKYNDLYAWPVHDGDVAAPIPEPETYAMLLAGLSLLGFMGRRGKQKEAAAI